MVDGLYMCIISFNSENRELPPFLPSSLAFSQSHCPTAKGWMRRRWEEGRVITPGRAPLKPRLLILVWCSAFLCDRNTERQEYVQH